MNGSYLGPEFKNNEIEKIIKYKNLKFKKLEHKKLPEIGAKLLLKGNVIGWFQGRMEFGPRALGNRSILGNPKLKNMQKNLNIKIKFRESFRPFAPSVLEEDLEQWFDLKTKSPFMLLKELNKIYQTKHSWFVQKNKTTDKINVVRSVVPSCKSCKITRKI